MNCTKCGCKEYNIADNTVKCLDCGTIAPLGATISQITHINGKPLSEIPD